MLPSDEATVRRNAQRRHRAIRHEYRFPIPAVARSLPRLGFHGKKYSSAPLPHGVSLSSLTRRKARGENSGQMVFRFASSVCTENDMLRIENLALRAEVKRLRGALNDAGKLMTLYALDLHRLAQAPTHFREPDA